MKNCCIGKARWLDPRPKVTYGDFSDSSNQFTGCKPQFVCSNRRCYHRSLLAPKTHFCTLPYVTDYPIYNIANPEQLSTNTYACLER